MGLFLIFHLSESGLLLPGPDIQLSLYLITFVATFIFPLASALLLLKMNVINSLEMQTKEERKIPYLSAAVFYFSEAYFLMRIDLPLAVQAMMMGATLLIIITLVINLFWKISSHMVGIGGLCGMMVAISYRMQVNLHFMLILLFLIAGLVAYSRLRLNAHSAAEVYAGFFLGTVVQFFFFISL